MQGKQILIALFLLSLVGCSDSSTTVPTKSLPSTMTPLVASSLTIPTVNSDNLIPTITPIPSLYPSLTNTPSPNSSSTEAVFRNQCLDIEKNSSLDIRPEGSLVLSGYSDEPGYILHFSNMSRQDLPAQAMGFSISPDGNWLAYAEVTGGPANGWWLVIRTADGKKSYRTFAPLKWGFPHTWPNNDQVAFNLFGNPDEVPKIGVITPATGKTEILPSDFPDLKPYAGAGGIPEHFRSTSMVFDPTLQFVVYPKTADKNEWYIVLWDVQSGKAVVSLRDEGYFYHLPIWSPDGKYFYIALVKKQENETEDNYISNWFRVSREGSVQQLTFFETLFLNNDIGGASISPDGRQLAFELEAKSDFSTQEQLIMLNIETQEMTNYCIPGGGSVWSLDSRYLAVAVGGDQEPVRTILVDTHEPKAFEIANGVSPDGWLAEP